MSNTVELLCGCCDGNIGPESRLVLMASPGYVMIDIKRTFKAMEWRGQSQGRLQGNSPFAMHYAML